MLLSAGPEPFDTASRTEKLWEGFSHRLETSIWFITSGVRSNTSTLTLDNYANVEIISCFAENQQQLTVIYLGYTYQKCHVPDFLLFFVIIVNIFGFLGCLVKTGNVRLSPEACN